MFTREELLKHYETMVKIRKFDLEAKRAREAGEILGNVHVYVGEEAVATGVCACLERKDYIESTHRGHGHTIAKGAELNPMMAELYGKATGSCKGKGGSQHIADFSVGMLGANGIVGGGFGLAVGAALAARYQKTGAISVVFFGEAGEEMRAALLTADGVGGARDAAGIPPSRYIRDFSAAVEAALAATPVGGTLVLSPAAASFDAFGSYRERAETYKRLLYRLAGKTYPQLQSKK